MKPQWNLAGGWYDGYQFTISPKFKFDNPCHFGKKRIIATFTNIDPRMNPSSSLTHQDRTCIHNLPIESLYAKPLRITIATVFLFTTTTFNVSHCTNSPSSKNIQGILANSRFPIKWKRTEESLFTQNGYILVNLSPEWRYSIYEFLSIHFALI